MGAAGHAQATSGARSTVDGEDPAALDAPGAARLVGLVPQTAADLLYLETVATSAPPPTARPAHDPARRGRCSTGSLPASTRRPHPRDLSEGQRLALVLAVVLTAQPPVICSRRADPRARLPRQGGPRRDPARPGAEGRAVLVATHDVEFVAQVADRVVVLAEGEIVSEGPTAHVVAESPAFAPQVLKILGDGWLTSTRSSQRGRR